MEPCEDLFAVFISHSDSAFLSIRITGNSEGTEAKLRRTDPKKENCKKERGRGRSWKKERAKERDKDRDKERDGKNEEKEREKNENEELKKLRKS